MAAEAATLSKTLKEAEVETHNTFLEILRQRLGKDRGILSPVLDPVGFPEVAWLRKNITLAEINTALFEKCRGRLPKDITYSDYVDFMTRDDVDKILSYFKGIEVINYLEPNTITTFASKFEIADIQAMKIIALIIQGKTEPYLPIITSENYQFFLTNIEKLKNMLYYRAARKEINDLPFDSSGSILSQLASRMKKIVSIIERASYDKEPEDKTIRYEVNGLEREKKLPQPLYLYRETLLKLIVMSETPVDVETYRQNFNKEMARFVDSLMSEEQIDQDPLELYNSIHYKMHNDFLTSLHAIIEGNPRTEPLRIIIELLLAKHNPSFFKVAAAEIRARDSFPIVVTPPNLSKF